VANAEFVEQGDEIGGDLFDTWFPGLAVGMRKLLHPNHMAQRPIRPWTNEVLAALLDKFERDDFPYLSAAISKLPVTFGVDKATGVPIAFHKFDFIHQVWKDRGTICRSVDEQQNNAARHSGGPTSFPSAKSFPI
jgi:hypothetical protein